jgi:dynein heavy chain
LIGKLEDFNATSDNRMSLVFFEDAMHHILRICRALRQPRGNLMLIGVGGSGKQSLTKLASSIYEIQYKMIEMKKDYKITDFRDFIKNIMFQTAGVEEEEKKCRPTVFTLTDSQIIDETFLEDISSILNTGEIPNLMLPEDKDKILNELRDVVQKMGKIDTADVIQQTFVDRVRENFHICLAMSPVGDALRIRCRQFPSLVNCCTLDWFSRWPAEALLYVSSEFLKEVDMPNEEVRRQVSEMCMIIHTSVEEISVKFWDELRRRVYTTPKSYLDLIKLYINKLANKRKKDNANRDRLALGVKKLNQTNTEIALLKERLKVLQPELEKSDKELAVVLEKVAVEKAIADEEEERVSKEGAEVAKQAAEA